MCSTRVLLQYSSTLEYMCTVHRVLEYVCTRVLHVYTCVAIIRTRVRTRIPVHVYTRVHSSTGIAYPCIRVPVPVPV